MKQLYILLILICILTIVKYISNKKTKKIYREKIYREKKKYREKNIKMGGKLLEDFNDKTTYFKIKINTIDDTYLITTEGSQITLKKNTEKIVDVPNENIWEINLRGNNYMIQNSLNKLTLAENIIQINENNKTKGLESKKIFTYDNSGYGLQLVRNKNIFNIYFEDTGDNNLGKIYLLLDESKTNIISKSEKEMEVINTDVIKLIEKSKAEGVPIESLEELENRKINKLEFIIEPYKLNLFNKENHIITHYENFVNNFNYEKFNLLFSLQFKHIIIPKIFKFKNDNKLTNNTDTYNIYPLNWISGPITEPTVGSSIPRQIGNRKIDVRFKDLYKNIDERQVLISETYKTNKTNTTRGKKNIDKNDKLALWRLIYDDENKTYEIKNIKNNLSILKQVEENSRKFFPNFVNGKKLENFEKQKIDLEEIPDNPNYYNLSFKVKIEGENNVIKLYLSTSDWGGILVAREENVDFILNTDDILNNAFIIEHFEDDERESEKILVKQTYLGLSDDNLNDIIPDSVNTNEKMLKKKYNKINNNIIRDYINSYLYEKYYEKMEFKFKTEILNKITTYKNKLSKSLEIDNHSLLEIRIDDILKKSSNIEKTIETIQYIFNIKKYTNNEIEKYYNSNPIGDILTIGNSTFNIHNFFIKIESQTKNKTDYKLILGFIKYLNNIEIPLNNIKNSQGKFPSLIDFKLEYEKPYLNIFISFLKKTEKIEGYLDINGNIKKKSDEQKMKEFKNLNTDINFEIYFPAYINPWCSIGSIDNINVDTNLNEYIYMENSFLSKKFKTNKLIKNVKYNTKKENNEVHILSSLNKEFKNVYGEETIRLNNKNSLIFNIKKKNVESSNVNNSDDILKYGDKKYIYNHTHTILGSCNAAPVNDSCGPQNHHLDLYLLNSSQVQTAPHVHEFKLLPQSEGKTEVEYGDKFWITMRFKPDGSGDGESHILNCNEDKVYVNFGDRKTFKSKKQLIDEGKTNFNIYTYEDNSLIQIISSIGKKNGSKVLKTDKFFLQFVNLNYLCAGTRSQYEGCGDKIWLGIRGTKNSNILNKTWSVIDTETPLINTKTNEALLFDNAFSSHSDTELFNIKGKNETIKFSIKNDHLLITEHDIRYIKNDDTFNESLEHINHINTICNTKLKSFFSVFNNIIFDFVPIHNQYSLTIHNGNKFINYILNINLSEILRETKINVNNDIELKYKIGIIDPVIKYISIKIPENNNEEMIIKKDANQPMLKNYFGTKIKNNFYKSNRIKNLILKISSDTNEITDKLNPQTILWNNSYNNEKSTDWRCGVDCIDKMNAHIKNNFLNVDNTPQSIIYEFNRQINISSLIFDLKGGDGNMIKFEYFNENTNKYVTLLDKLNMYGDSWSKNWFDSQPKSYNNRDAAETYCINKETTLVNYITKMTYQNNPFDAWFKNDFGYSYAIGQKTGIANTPYNGPAICLKKTQEIFNNDILAYKFRLSTVLTKGSSQNIYNIFMNGKIGRNYPVFEKQNVGIGFIKSKNKLPEKNIFVNYIKDKYGTWIKVGIFKGNAVKSIKNTIKSVHNLSILTDQNVNSAFSADFGEIESSEVRILGANDYNNWEETKTIDWVYKVPKNALGKYKRWKQFFKPVPSGNFSPNISHGMWGFEVDGAYDGRGRWKNDQFKFVGLSHQAYSFNPNAYNESNLNINIGTFNDDGGLNVKGDPAQMNWGSSYNTSGLGVYDGREYFYDINYNDEETPHFTKYRSGAYFQPKYNDPNKNGKIQHFTSAVWVLLKIDEDDLEIMNGTLDEVKSNLFRRRDDLENEKNMIKIDIENKTASRTLKIQQRSVRDTKKKQIKKQMAESSRMVEIWRSNVNYLYLQRVVEPKSGSKVYLSAEYWPAYYFTSNVYERGPFTLRKPWQNPGPAPWIMTYSGSLSSGKVIQLQKPNGSFLHGNTGIVQNISMGGASTYWGWQMTWDGNMRDPWYKYSTGNEGGKKIKLKSYAYKRNFGVRYIGAPGRWKYDSNYGWYLRWITELQIHLIPSFGSSYLASNIYENGQQNLNYYYESTGWGMGWVIEFVGIPRSGMEIYLKSASNGKYLHSNRSGSYSIGGRNSTYNWTLHWHGALTPESRVWIGFRGLGGYIGGSSTMQKRSSMDWWGAWYIIWENSGRNLYFSKLANANQNSSLRAQVETIAQKREIEHIEKNIVNLKNKLEKNKNDLIELNDEIVENMK